MENRRTFIKNAGLVSLLSLLANAKAATGPFSGLELNNEGFILNKTGGEVWYIGARKAEVHIKASKATSGNIEMSLLTELVSPGDGIPEHKHLKEDEFLYILKGTAKLKVGDKEEVVRPGGLAYVPKTVWHSLTNVGDEDVMFFFGYSPAGFEDYFRAIGKASKEQPVNLTEDDWARINRKYNVVYR